MSRRGTNIRKRADGRWEGRYYIVNTAGSKKCKSVYGHSYKEVTERLLTAKAASLNQTAAPKQSAITVKEVAEKWLKSIASNRKCSTIQKYSTIYNKYIKPNWGESVIDQLNQNEILKLLPETAGESVTKSILCIFNSILAYGAATYGTGEIHLSYRVKRSFVTSSNNINTINTTDQQKLTEYLLTKLDIYKLGILLCLFMGLRLGEICALKWEDIDMISRTLHVNRTVQRLPVDGCDVTIIDYVREDVRYENLVKKWSGGNPIKTLAIIPTIFRWKKVFRSFTKKYLDLSENTYTTEDDFESYPLDADAYCTGSDQVWNSKWNNGILPCLYLSFVPNDKYKFAFSASFGQSKLLTEEINKTKPYLEQYNRISVRESEAKVILDEQYNICVYPKEFGGRLESILQQTNQTQRHIADYSDFDVVNRPVDFDYVGRILEGERKKANQFLKEVVKEAASL